MHLTRFTDYSLRTLMYLGRHDGTLVSLVDVARAYRIKENHLSKVVAHLARIGLIETVRGPRGGLRLARERSQIRVGEVIRGTEDNLALVECFASDACPLIGACGLAPAMHEALDAFLAVLDRYTLNDLICTRPKLS
jgi:Rrf2 family transcriptional regulator, nitric oxide-sensitive transcriptional repressor